MSVLDAEVETLVTAAAPGCRPTLKIRRLSSDVVWIEVMKKWATDREPEQWSFASLPLAAFREMVLNILGREARL